MIHTITPGFFCVPSAIQAITGEDMLSVIIPALNRATNAPWLLEEVTGVAIPATLKTLNELGYSTFRYKNTKALGEIHSWSNRFPENIMLLRTIEHVIVAYQGIGYDNTTPMGKKLINHPYCVEKVQEAYLIRKM